MPEKPTKGGAIIAAEYVDMPDGKTKYVVTSQNNNTLNFWNPDNYIWKERINPSSIQLCLKWCGGYGVNKLFSGSLGEGDEAKIHVYDVNPPKEIPYGSEGLLGSSKMQKEIRHTKSITDLLPIPEINLMASVSMDSNMILWNLKDLTPRSLHDEHTKPLYCLEWYADQSLILSAGLDSYINIWNPIVKDRIFWLKGHNHSIAGIKWMKGTNQIISADISGMFKIWDVRNFAPIQTFNIPLNEINCFSLSSPPKRIIAGGRKLVFYDYSEPTDIHLADDQACLSVLYNPVFFTFITSHPKCIKIWDACSGAL